MIFEESDTRKGVGYGQKPTRGEWFAGLSCFHLNRLPTAIKRMSVCQQLVLSLSFFVSNHSLRCGLRERVGLAGLDFAVRALVNWLPSNNEILHKTAEVRAFN
jgi:hypothetical protein